MKPNVIVALVVGLVLGIVIGKATSTNSGPGKSGPTPTAQARPPQPRPVDTTVYRVPVGDSPVRGDANAPLTLVEFSDYQCPYCGRANTTVDELARSYGSKMRVVMKEFPLPFHPNAKPAALAALAAGSQGKYWQMHDLLFANQTALTPDNLADYAKRTGVDVEQWKTAQSNPSFEEVMKRDTALGSQLGVTGTPAFFLNGRKLVGAQPIDNFKALAEEELKKANALIASGTAPADVYNKIMERAVDKAPAAPTKPGQAAPGATVKKVDVPADSPIHGPKYAKVTVVEFSDFQCPYCKRGAQDLVAKIEQSYPKDVRVVFRNNPLDMHPNARGAALASVAAHEQGKFWELHDKMFSNQAALDPQSLEKSAQELGLNMSKFRSARDSEQTAARVKKDIEAANTYGAQGTPNFFVNGRQVTGAVPFEQMKPLIDEEIAKADKLLKSGTKLADLYEKELDVNTAGQPAAPVTGSPTNVAVGQSPVLGPTNAPVTIVEFSDFQCPFCGKAYQTVKQLQSAYQGKVKFAFKNQPLDMHPNAKPAALAAMAANEQGKFWEYHDLLFTHQSALDRASLDQYAEQLGLNMNKFRAALDNKKYEAQINADSAEGNRVGAEGTPTFFVNGQKIVGAESFETFKTIIDGELKKPAGGTGRLRTAIH